MLICGIKQTLPGVYEITPNAGSAFFLRSKYLSRVQEHQLVPFAYGRLDISEEDKKNAKEGDSGFFNEEDSLDIMEASIIYSVELIAMRYLARAEQYRFSLFNKLLKKGLNKNHINKVLDFLEEEDFLNDERFAGAWLRTRAIDHFEGKNRLYGELFSRGVKNEAINNALNLFFSENSEEEICYQAYSKFVKLGYNSEKLYSALFRAGFSVKNIKKVLNDK